MCRALFIFGVSVLSLTTDVTGIPRTFPEGLSLHKTAMSWEEAKRVCQTEGGTLASPISNKAYDAMKSVMGYKNTKYFIGMKAYNYTSPFVSLDGVPLNDLVPDVMNLIDMIDQRNGDCLALDQQSLRTIPCWSRLPFMCYNTSKFIMPKCGPEADGYKYHELLNNCYKTHTNESNWAEAEKKCITENGHLVVIENIDEARGVNKLINDLKWESSWTGVRDVTGKGNWTSVHGQSLTNIFNEWSITLTEPLATPDGCLMLWHKTYLSWSFCSHKANFICEREITF